MPRSKRPFIDKHKSVSFKLVERSQNDPLYFDDTAPKYVLVEKQTKQSIHVDADEPNDDNKPKTELERKSEQVKYGIYYDDDYNYLQHLVDIEEVADIKVDIEPKETAEQKHGLVLPSSLFESTVKEKVDLSVKAALPVGPQLDWDPDIVEAMEDDFDFNDPNNQLDDNFVVQAMGEKDDDEENFSDEEQISDDDNLSICGYDGSGGESDYEDECRDQFDSNISRLDLMGQKNINRFFGIQQTDDQMSVKSSGSTHFTEYSMSSSVLPRNENLKSLDEQFEQMYIKEYAEDTTVGALDCEEINGTIDPNKSELLASLAEEYQEMKAGKGIFYEKNQEAIEFARNYIEKFENNQVEPEGEKYEEIEIVDVGRKGDKDRFDCESILSTYSNTLYHPTVLKDTDRYGNPLAKRKGHIRIDPRTGIPVGAFDDPSALSVRNLKSLDLDLGAKSTRSNASRLSELSVRPKNETTEERRLRKKELKDFRNQRRAEKKANRVAFQEEKLRLHKSDLNKTVQKKVAVL